MNLPGFNEMKEAQGILLNYLDNDCESLKLNDQLIEYIDKQNRVDTEIFLYTLLKISNNHHRSKFFFNKIEEILRYYKTKIKQNFSNQKIFDFFQFNNRILLILLKEEILILDDYVIQRLQESKHFLYFRPIIQPDLQEKSDYDEFRKKQEIGENDSYICELIRNDSITEFVQYISRQNIPLRSKIEKSEFETNSFLINKYYYVEPARLIDYAAFFGSIKIFNYLFYSEINSLNSSIWLYAIHGRNAKIINTLVNNNILPRDKTFIECLNESLECFHNEIADYILHNLINEPVYCTLIFNLNTINDEHNQLQYIIALYRFGGNEIIKNLLKKQSLDPKFLEMEIVI